MHQSFYFLVNFQHVSYSCSKFLSWTNSTGKFGLWPRSVRRRNIGDSSIWCILQWTWRSSPKKPIMESMSLTNKFHSWRDSFILYFWRYTSLEEFQVDCETLFHAIGCYFGPDLTKGVAVGASFMRDVMHDINVSDSISSDLAFRQLTWICWNRKSNSATTVSAVQMKRIIHGGFACHVMRRTKSFGPNRLVTRIGLQRFVS